MEILTVSDPDSVTFPLHKETWDDPDIFYHGSSKIHSEKIERDGFIMGWRPYDISEITKFADLCTEIERRGFIDGNDRKFHAPHGTCQSFALVSDETISFTGSYWQAMGFSRKQGGETIRAAIKLASRVCELIPAFENISKSEEGWSVAQKTKVHSMKNQDLFDTTEDFSRKILDKYADVYKKHVPCIYAVRLEDDKDHHRDNRSKFAGIGELLKNFHVTRNIPKESIEIRIDFPNGIASQEKIDSVKDNGPFPLPWD